MPVCKCKYKSFQEQEEALDLWFLNYRLSLPRPWVLGTKLGSSMRAVHTFSHPDISPAFGLNLKPQVIIHAVTIKAQM